MNSIISYRSLHTMVQRRPNCNTRTWFECYGTDLLQHGMVAFPYAIELFYREVQMNEWELAVMRLLLCAPHQVNAMVVSGVEELAEHFRLSTRQIRRKLNEMVKKGFLLIVPHCDEAGKKTGLNVYDCNLFLEAIYRQADAYYRSIQDQAQRDVTNGTVTEEVAVEAVEIEYPPVSEPSLLPEQRQEPIVSSVTAMSPVTAMSEDIAMTHVSNISDIVEARKKMSLVTSMSLETAQDHACQSELASVARSALDFGVSQDPNSYPVGAEMSVVGTPSVAKTVTSMSLGTEMSDPRASSKSSNSNSRYINYNIITNTRQPKTKDSKRARALGFLAALAETELSPTSSAVCVSVPVAQTEEIVIPDPPRVDYSIPPAQDFEQANSVHRSSRRVDTSIPREPASQSDSQVSRQTHASIPREPASTSDGQAGGQTVKPESSKLEEQADEADVAQYAQLGTESVFALHDISNRLYDGCFPSSRSRTRKLYERLLHINLVEDAYTLTDPDKYFADLMLVVQSSLEGMTFQRANNQGVKTGMPLFFHKLEKQINQLVQHTADLREECTQSLRGQSPPAGTGRMWERQLGGQLSVTECYTLAQEIQRLPLTDAQLLELASQLDVPISASDAAALRAGTISEEARSQIETGIRVGLYHERISQPVAASRLHPRDPVLA